MLHSLLFGERAKLGVIIDFHLRSIFEDWIWQSFVCDFSCLSQLHGLDITKTQLFYKGIRDKQNDGITGWPNPLMCWRYLWF